AQPRAGGEAERWDERGDRRAGLLVAVEVDADDRRAAFARPERALDGLAGEGAGRLGADAFNHVAADAEDQPDPERRPGLDLSPRLFDRGDDLLQRHVVGLPGAARAEAHLGV